jgi:hypothetical protein
MGMLRLKYSRRDAILLFAVGAILILAPIAAYVNIGRTQQREIAGIARLRQLLDSTTAALTRATGASDSIRLLEEVRTRRWYLGRREYHLPFRAARLKTWWRLGGPPTLLVAAGVLLAVGGIIVLRHPKGAT